MKILVIDDDFMNVEVLRRSFKDYFIAWNQTVFNGTEEDREYYDLILVDVLGTGYNDVTLKYYDKEKTWVNSSAMMPQKPNGFRFVIKDSVIGSCAIALNALLLAPFLLLAVLLRAYFFSVMGLFNVRSGL